MAGAGARFKEAGYAFPKPLIDIVGKTMIEVVVNNIKPKQLDYKFIFIAQREHYNKYDIYNILKRATDNKFEIVLIDGLTQGAACTVLTAIAHINNESPLLIANSDQFITEDIDNFISKASGQDKDGMIMTFASSHPKWSYARSDDSGRVVEVAEKRVISNAATVGLYYFKYGSDFVEGAQAMILKNIRHNNEFYVCPVYNELILSGKKIYTHPITHDKMHGLGTPEDLDSFLQKLKMGDVKLV